MSNRMITFTFKSPYIDKSFELWSDRVKVMAHLSKKYINLPESKKSCTTCPLSEIRRNNRNLSCLEIVSAFSQETRKPMTYKEVENMIQSERRTLFSGCYLLNEWLANIKLKTDRNVRI